jgi:hypothetical protein
MLHRKTIASVKLTVSAAEGYVLSCVFAEVDPLFQGIDLKKDLFLQIMLQAEASRGTPYPASGLVDALVDVRLLFERATPTSAYVFKAIEFDDVADLKAALDALL